MQNRALPAAFQLRSRPSCTSRAHKAETQCTRGAQRQRSRCQQQRYNAALHRQSYTLPYSALARQSACMLVLRLHLAATAMSDRTQASFRHRPRRQPPMSRISTQPASIRTGAVHDGGCLLASAADNNLMSSAELEERRQPTLVSPRSNAVAARLRSAGVPCSRSHGAQGASFAGWHSFYGLRRSKSACADSQVLAKIVCRIPRIGDAPKRNDSRPKLAELSPKLESSRRELSNDTLTVE